MKFLKSKFFLSAAFLISPFIVHAWTPTISISPEIMCFDKSKTATITVTPGEYFDADGDPFIESMTPEGCASISGLTVTFSAPGVVTVGQKFKRNSTEPEPGENIPDTAYDDATCKAVQVGLTAGSTTKISPKICLNAQDEYKKTEWTAKVLPSGTTAHVELYDGEGSILTTLTGVIDGAIIIVTGVSPGSYKLKIIHDDLPSCEKETEEGVVFKFDFVVNYGTPQIKEDYAMEIDTGIKKGPNEGYYPYAMNVNHCIGLNNLMFISIVDLPWDYLLAGYNAEFSVSVNNGVFYVITNPKGAWSNVKADLYGEIVGSIESTDNGTTNYGAHAKLDNFYVTFSKALGGGIGAGGTLPISVSDRKKIAFVVNKTKGIMRTKGKGCHSCAQAGGAPNWYSKAGDNVQMKVEAKGYEIQ